MEIRKIVDFCSNFCNKSYPIAPLITFRVLFGLAMVISTLRFVFLGWIADHYIHTKFTFKYYGFGWVELLPAWAMYGLHFVMLVAAVGICLGAWYQISAILFFVSFTYCQLIDLSYYLNHYYFVSLVSLLLCFVPAHAAYSIDSWRNPDLQKKEVPFWYIGIFRLQLSLVYVYAGLAKINSTWLFSALPLRIWLPAADKMPLLGWFFKQNWVAYVFAWCGMFYDIFIVFFLSYSKTRWFAYGCVLLFHLIVGLLFQIGVFPLVMILATPIFFSADWHTKIWTFFAKFSMPFFAPLSRSSTIGKVQKNTLPCQWSKTLAKVKYLNWLKTTILVLFFTFQVLFPFRYLFYKGNLFWTEQGYRFSWRVMLMEKAGTATFYVKDSKTNREGVVINSDFLTMHQEKQMAMQPDMILQFAHFLQAHYQKQGVYAPQVRAEVYVTLNGQASRLLFSPYLDLTKIEDSWVEKNWLFE